MSKWVSDSPSKSYILSTNNSNKTTHYHSIRVQILLKVLYSLLTPHSIQSNSEGILVLRFSLKVLYFSQDNRNGTQKDQSITSTDSPQSPILSLIGNQECTDFQCYLKFWFFSKSYTWSKCNHNITTSVPQ
jgi:hypothetical protein